jgi:hypothetical protein
MKTKECSVCREEKRLDEYHRNPSTKDGLGSQCRSCDAERQRRRKYDKKKAVVDASGGRCQRCGYDKCLDALEWHHRDGTTKEHEVANLYRKGINRLMTEVHKCDLLCANCHREVHAELRPPMPERTWKMRSKEVKHGTVAGAKKCGPPACQPCKDARNKAQREYKAKKRKLKNGGCAE